MNGKRYGRGLIAAFSALVAVVAIILAVFVISGDEADLSYRSVDFDARLQSNGDIRFTEHLDYQLKRREDGNGDTKPWKQLYLTFKLRNQDLTNITDISVTNASTGEEYTQTDPQLPSGISDGTWDSTYAGHWYIADTTAGSDSPQPFDPTTDGIDPNGSGEQKNIEIGWNIPATVKQSSLKFDVSMTFHDMGTRHSDVTNLMWEMFPENNQVPAGKVTGTVRERPEGQDNEKLATGHIEVLVSELEVLNTSVTPPFQIEDHIDCSEDVRLRYRYLDIRRPKMAANLKLRSDFTFAIRQALHNREFTEVETPALFKSTPEGARDFSSCLLRLWCVVVRLKTWCRKCGVLITCPSRLTAC